MSPATTAAAEYTAKHRYARITARKARLIADVIRGQSVNRALETLEFAPQRAAAFYKKLVRSAMANASQDESVNVNHLVISECRADDGPMLQSRMRWRPGPQGRAMPYKKLTSHLTVRVSEEQDEQPPAPVAAAESAPAKKKASKKKAEKTTKESTGAKSAKEEGPEGA